LHWNCTEQEAAGYSSATPVQLPSHIQAMLRQFPYSLTAMPVPLFSILARGKSIDPLANQKIYRTQKICLKPNVAKINNCRFF
jgi:hypothetical protein